MTLVFVEPHTKLLHTFCSFFGKMPLCEDWIGRALQMWGETTENELILASQLCLDGDAAPGGKMYPRIMKCHGAHGSQQWKWLDQVCLVTCCCFSGFVWDEPPQTSFTSSEIDGQHLRETEQNYCVCQAKKSFHSCDRQIFYTKTFSTFLQRQLLNPANGRCLSVESFAVGAYVYLEICDQSSSQFFRFVSVP